MVDIRSEAPKKCMQTVMRDAWNREGERSGRANVATDALSSLRVYSVCANIGEPRVFVLCAQSALALNWAGLRTMHPRPECSATFEFDPEPGPYEYMPLKLTIAAQG